MELMEKQAFLDKAQTALAQIYAGIAQAPTLDRQSLDKTRTAVLVLSLIHI